MATVKPLLFPLPHRYAWAGSSKCRKARCSLWALLKASCPTSCRCLTPCKVQPSSNCLQDLQLLLAMLTCVWLDVAGGVDLAPNSPHRTTIANAARSLPEQLQYVCYVCTVSALPHDGCRDVETCWLCLEATLPRAQGCNGKRASG